MENPKDNGKDIDVQAGRSPICGHPKKASLMLTLCKVCGNLKINGEWRLCVTRLKTKYRAVVCPACQRENEGRYSGRLVIQLPEQGHFVRDLRTRCETASKEMQRENYFARVSHFRGGHGSFACETLTTSMPIALAKELLTAYEGTMRVERDEGFVRVMLTLTGLRPTTSDGAATPKQEPTTDDFSRKTKK